VQRLELGEGQEIRFIIFGEVVLVHVRDELWVRGKLELSRLRFMGRLGTGVYCRTTDVFGKGDI